MGTVLSLARDEVLLLEAIDGISYHGLSLVLELDRLPHRVLLLTISQLAVSPSCSWITSLEWLLDSNIPDSDSLL